MANDPYKVLGVPKSASQADIRKAYRKLAKQLHPDIRPNDKKAEEKFKNASAAFALLNNEEERAKFDRGEIDADGSPTGAYANSGARSGGFPGGFAPGGHEDIADILSELFGRQAGMRGRGSFARRGEDLHYTLNVDLVESIKGGTKHVRVAGGKQIKIQIPAGVKSGKSLRLKAQGSPGIGGGPPGDAIVEIRVAPHKFYIEDGANLRMDVPITLKEAVLGAKVKVPTPDGSVSLSIPANTSSGKVFRIKGKGGVGPNGRRGDLLARTLIMLSSPPDKNLVKILKSDKTLSTQDPRSTFYS